MPDPVDDDTAGRDESQTGLNSQAEGSRERWGGLPISEIRGSVKEIEAHLPRFERRSFITPPSNLVTGTVANSFYDAVVRLPLEKTTPEVSVGIVRKSYQLVQHVDLFNLVIDAFQKAKVEIEKIQATLKSTPNAERIRLTMLLPDTDKFQFRISATDHMNLRFELFNSVDASTRCVALLGWFRFVCGNGLVVGVTQMEVHGVHNGRLDVNAIGTVLSKGLTDAIREKMTFERWLKLRVFGPALGKWVDGPLKKLWGAKAAARVYHIALEGRDVTLTDPFERAAPSQKSVEPGMHVRGSGLPDELERRNPWLDATFARSPSALSGSESPRELREWTRRGRHPTPATNGSDARAGASATTGPAKSLARREAKPIPRPTARQTLTRRPERLICHGGGYQEG